MHLCQEAARTPREVRDFAKDDVIFLRLPKGLPHHETRRFIRIAFVSHRLAHGIDFVIGHHAIRTSTPEKKHNKEVF